MQYNVSMHPTTQAKQPMQPSTTVTRNGTTSPRLEITTPVVRITLVTVELVPVVSGGGTENTATYKLKVLGYNF